MKGVFQKTLGGFRPADPIAETWYSAIHLGTFVRLDKPAQPRNLGWHRKWWAMMTIIADNLPGNHSAENVCEVVKIRVGHVTRIGTKTGIVEIPKSISFSKMKSNEWSDFWDRAVKCICEEILPGLDKDDLTREIHEMIN